MLPFSEKRHSKEISSTCCSGHPTNMPNFPYPPNMSNFPYPPNMPNFGYPNMLPPNYNNPSTPMYNYGGTQIPMVMPVYNYPPHPGYQMVGNYSPMWEITQECVKWNNAREDKGKSEQMSESKRSSCNSSPSPIGKKIAKVRKKDKTRKSKKGLYDD